MTSCVLLSFHAQQGVFPTQYWKIVMDAMREILGVIRMFQILIRVMGTRNCSHLSKHVESHILKRLNFIICKLFHNKANLKKTNSLNRILRMWHLA